MGANTPTTGVEMKNANGSVKVMLMAVVVLIGSITMACSGPTTEPERTPPPERPTEQTLLGWVEGGGLEELEDVQAALSEVGNATTTGEMQRAGDALAEAAGVAKNNPPPPPSGEHYEKGMRYYELAGEALSEGEMALAMDYLHAGTLAVDEAVVVLEGA